MSNKTDTMLATTSFALSDPQTSARGAKSCTLLDKDGQKVTVILGSKEAPTSTPFGASSYNDEATVRKNLDLRLNDQQADQFTALDVWAVQYLADNSERLFKKKLTKAQVEEHYRSPVSQREGYQPLLRCKVNCFGNAAVRCWNTDSERVDMPEDLRECELVPRLHLSHLWIMGRDFGWVMNVTDLMILSTGAQGECPF